MACHNGRASSYICSSYILNRTIYIMATIRILLTSVIFTKEQENATRECYKSLLSDDHTLDVFVDTFVYKYGLAECWNRFFNSWRWKDYDYLMTVCNDTIARPHAIDYMVKSLEENKGDVLLANFTRNIQDVNKLVQYSSKTIDRGDSANWIMRKGVIEDIGNADRTFRNEFIERDYFRRCELAGKKVLTTKDKWFYHPPDSDLSIQTRTGIQIALPKYIRKWGGDYREEKYEHPYNTPELSMRFIDQEL
jgi:hypothetical protein